ncbi:hypothetical protein [Bacillus cereus]|uniref:hypothetical protein n=1 Tax=Bacillus cereus TaxID=1396 RepID=UPI001596A612|nr:hypothetical protein [Bacillus cereus]
MSNMFGLKEYPLKPTSTGGSTLGMLTVYRFLGIDKNHLNCESTILIATRLKTDAEPDKCLGEAVVSLTVPVDEQIPYMDITYGSSLINDTDVGFFGSRRHLTIMNNSGLELCVEWFRDVHQDYHIDYLVNGAPSTQKSRSVNTTASFPIKVSRSTGGNTKGEELGSFTVEVLGHDYVRLVTVTIDGQVWLQAISTVEQPARILLNILL